MSDSTRVQVSILDKPFHVACQAEEKDALAAAARELDSRMRRIRNSGAIIGMDRIAVMAGLNLCHELQQARAQLKAQGLPEEDLARLAEKLEKALE